MAESKSAALPLGYTPKVTSPTKYNIKNFLGQILCIQKPSLNTQKVISENNKNKRYTEPI